MLSILEPSDLSPFADIEPAKADAMVTHVQALAVRVAPCLKTSTDEDVLAAAKAILLGVVLRWQESGLASYQVTTVGPPGYPTDPRRERRNMLWPSEVEELQALCKEASGASGEAFAVDTLPIGLSPHAETCALNFGATYCSCGAILTNLLYPLYEV